MRNFSCGTDHLVKACKVFAKLTKTWNRSALPTMSWIRIQQSGGITSLLASSFDLQARWQLEFHRPDVEDRVWIQGYDLIDIVKTIPKCDTIRFSFGENHLRLESTNPAIPFSVSLPLLKDEEDGMPDRFKVEKEDWWARLSGPQLHKSLEMSRKITANQSDESRVVMQCINLREHRDRVLLTATDGRRLTTFEAPGDFSEKNPPNTLNIPSLAFQLIAGEVKSEEAVFVSYLHPEGHKEPREFRISTNFLVVSGWTFQGRYPDPFKVVPTNFATKAMVSADRLVSSLKYLCAVSSRDRRTPNLVRFQFKEDGLKMTASCEGLHSSVFLKWAWWEGQDLTVGINAKYLLDYLKELKQTDVVFHLQPSPAKSILLTRREDENGTDSKAGNQYVVMPVKLRDVEDEDFSDIEEEPAA